MVKYLLLVSKVTIVCLSPCPRNVNIRRHLVCTVCSSRLLTSPPSTNMNYTIEYIVRYAEYVSNLNRIHEHVLDKQVRTRNDSEENECACNTVLEML